uniref:Uncharacterized protein n=1 Tax=Arundo donax TaxID=35708 RepID=A0A0A9GNK1_ARUDO
MIISPRLYPYSCTQGQYNTDKTQMHLEFWIKGFNLNLNH